MQIINHTIIYAVVEIAHFLHTVSVSIQPWSKWAR